MAKKSKIKVWFVSSGSDKKNAEPFDSLDTALRYTRGMIKKEHSTLVSLESKDVTVEEFSKMTDSLHHA